MHHSIGSLKNFIIHSRICGFCHDSDRVFETLRFWQVGKTDRQSLCMIGFTKY